MISRLQGILLEQELGKESFRVELDVHGVGYEVFLPRASESPLKIGQTITLFISESVTAYDGATTLYGFVSKEQKEFFEMIREHVGGMGPKKALECIEKITKSLPDFKRAVIENDLRLLVSVFGFTKKTAEKLVFSLKGKVDSWAVRGSPKWAVAFNSHEEMDAHSGLINLGYSEEEARILLEQVKKKLGEKAEANVLLQEALKVVGARYR